jgi:ketosteroid isomerase-like protein
MSSNSAIIEANRKVVNNFFVALETQRFDMLKEVFAVNGKQLNPYAPENFPKSFDGAEAIYKQYSGLTANFGTMKFPREIFATEDPNFFFVKFKGEIEIKAGGKYENDYIGTFRLENGQITEYTEYFNQVVMAEAFDIKL